MSIYDQLQLMVNLSLGLMFAISSTAKLGSPKRFMEGVANYGLVPQPFVSTFAIFVIVTEAVLSVLHLTGRLVAAPLALSLLCMFFAAVSTNLIRKRAVPCHCFGSGSAEMISSRSLIRLALAISGECFLLVQGGDWLTPLYAQVHVSPTDILLGVSWTLFIMLAIKWGLSLPDLIRLRLFRWPSVTISRSYQETHP
jgi:uncharacterized membrane protein YphA (DoxX/SURF4 family)